MATHKSAIKRNRQNIKHREHNRAIRSEAKTLAQEAVVSFAKDKNAAKELLRKAVSRIASAARKGALPKTRAARKISRLQKRFNQATA